MSVTISKSFTAVGNGLELYVRHGDSFTFSVSGTFAGTVVLERSLNGGISWEPIRTKTAADSGLIIVEVVNGSSAIYRYRCSAYTSGTIVTSMTEVAKVLFELKNNRGAVAFQVTEDGVAVGGGGTTVFTGLTDVPSAYTGEALKFVRVNAGETGLEFTASAGTSGWSQSTTLITADAAATTLNLASVETIKSGSTIKALWDNTLFLTAFGYNALDSVTSGTLNCAFGNSALTALTTGTKCNAVGNQALRSQVTGTCNAFGSSALQYSTGTGNTGFGHGTLFSQTTGTYGTALGHQAGHHGCVANSIFIGHDCGFNDGAMTQTGNITEGIAIGYLAFVNRDNSCVLGGNSSTREINLGINVSEPQYKITLPGFNNNTIGTDRTVASATAGKNLTISAGSPQVSGVITTMSTTPTSGGTGYVASAGSPDEFTITTGDGTATGFVETVSGGVVTKVYLIKRGTGYSTGTGQATSGGSGTGLTVNITAVTAAPTNLNGGDLILTSGASTGTGGSKVVIKSSTSGSSGSTENSLVERIVVAPSKALTDAATSLFEVALPTLTMAGGSIAWTIMASDGTDMQAFSGITTWAAVNKGGTYTTTVTTNSSNDAKAVSSGTLTASFAFLNGTNKVTMQVTPAGSLTETTYKIKYVVTNNSPQAITIV